jgi:transcription elongation factor GreB
MNKAFKKDQDDNHEELENAPSPTAQSKNYITPQGFKRLQDELKHLLNIERPKVCETVAWAAGNGDRSENADYTYGKRRLREIDRRARFLTKQLEAAIVVDPLAITQRNQVMFGATVTISNEEGEEKIYSIVGVDEVDVVKGKISWCSPLGAALLKAQTGDTITYLTPKGKQEVEVLGIEYCQIL